MYTVVHGNTWCGTWQYMVWCIPPSCFVALSASLHQVFSSCKKRIGFIFSPSPMASQSWIWYSSSKLSFQRWPILKHLAQNINFSKPFLSIWELIWVTQSGESQNYPESDTWKNFKMQFRKGGKICTTVVICQRQPAFTSKTYFIPVVKCHGPCFSTCFSSCLKWNFLSFCLQHKKEFKNTTSAQCPWSILHFILRPWKFYKSIKQAGVLALHIRSDPGKNSLNYKGWKKQLGARWENWGDP